MGHLGLLWETFIFTIVMTNRDDDDDDDGDDNFHLTQYVSLLIEKLNISSVNKEIPHFIESKISCPCSQEPIMNPPP